LVLLGSSENSVQRCGELVNGVDGDKKEINIVEIQHVVADEQTFELFVRIDLWGDPISLFISLKRSTGGSWKITR
jgi:hypothetical protein